MKQIFNSKRHQTIVKILFIFILNIAVITTLTACSTQNSEVDKETESATNSSNQEASIENSTEVSTEALADSIWTSKILEGNLILREVHIFNGGLIGEDGNMRYAEYK